MKKIKVCVIFGGISTEHDVSIISGTSVIEKLDKEKYEIYPTYIDTDGQWYQYTKPVNQIKVTPIGTKLDETTSIKNITEYLKQMDIAFPVLHGLGGEDGSIQGLFKMLNLPYVGCGILSSSMGMDKVYAKVIFEKAGIPQTKYEYIKVKHQTYTYIFPDFSEKSMELPEIIKKVQTNLNYPMFIKPSNSGSSVGVKKANNQEELKQAVEYAAQFDTKILIEQGICGREVECAVLGKDEVISSPVGEVLSAEEFYSFDAKYINEASKTIIPAEIEKEISNQIRDFSIKAFQAIDGKGLSRVDFFIENKTNKVYINEINTLPGFTTVSMYPKLFEQIGINYSELLDRLIQLEI
ncbi:MAG: D-alanine--D-alanine ligase [Clostridia bacterium]|nr:D-alanine--D-alanine ligase [Clostridia bacterium]